MFLWSRCINFTRATKFTDHSDGAMRQTKPGLEFFSTYFISRLRGGESRVNRRNAYHLSQAWSVGSARLSVRRSSWQDPFALCNCVRAPVRPQSFC